MKELTALEQTIWNLAMTGGSVYSKKDNSIYQLCDSNLSMVLNNTDNNFLPILHSLNKLTEPVLEGGKVPIVELENMFGDLSSLTDTMLVNSWTINGIVKFLKNNHFNIENLNPDEFIEKSTLKIE